MPLVSGPSFGGDAVARDERAPAVNLVAQEAGLLGRRDGEHPAAVLLDARGEIGVAQYLGDRASQDRDRRRRRRRGRKQREPALALEVGLLQLKL